MSPLIQQWYKDGKKDAISSALVRRERGITLIPYADNISSTILQGKAIDVDRFLRYDVFIQPLRTFNGYVLVEFEMVSGIHLLPGQEACKLFCMGLKKLEQKASVTSVTAVMKPIRTVVTTVTAIVIVVTAVL